jgi:hypothetical protein
MQALPTHVDTRSEIYRTNRKTETLIACNILNGMTALGRPASCAIDA